MENWLKLAGNYLQIMNEALQDQALFYSSPETLRAQQSRMFREFFKYHYENCEDYRKFCQGRKVDPEMIDGLEDIPKVPLLDSFKTLRKRQFLSIPKKDVVAQFCSTGSSGKPLLWISMDQITMNWMTRASTLFNKTMIEIKPGATLLMLPYMPQLKFAVVSKAILSHYNQNIYFGLKATFGKDPHPTIQPDTVQIEKFLKDPAMVKNLIGFPFTITLLKKYLERHQQKLSLGEEGMIITGGGWKPRDKESEYYGLSREKIERIISEPFQVPVENIRDAYGCTEILLGFIECKNKRYHVPPWCYQVSVNSDNLEILGDGEEGLGACYDFASHSWPAFVLTEDFIKVYNEPCACGIAGQTIEYIGRIQDEDARGCSFKFEDKLFSEYYLNESIPKSDTSAMNGLLQYLLQNKEAVTGDFIKGQANLIKRAINTIIEALSVEKMELASAEDIESLQFVALGKLMCYKNGKPTLLSEEEIINQMPDLKPDVIRDILELFMKRKFVNKIQKEGQIYYRFTKKADQFGEAFYPLLIWALKYTN